VSFSFVVWFSPSRNNNDAIQCFNLRRFPCTITSWNVTDPVTMAGAWVTSVLTNETTPLGYSQEFLDYSIANANTSLSGELQWNWAVK
jgi:hypothetical protein